MTDLNRIAAERAALAAAIDQSSEAIVITDAAATIQYVNPAFERLTGYSRAEAIGKNPRFLQSGVQEPSFYQAMWAILKRGETWRGTFVNRARDGRIFEEDAAISPVFDSNGRLVNYVAVKRDVTRKLEAELALRRMEERYRDLLDFANDAIFIREPGGRFLDVNRTACERLGYTREQLLNMSPDDLDPTPGRPAEVTETILRQGTAVVETAHLTRDGRIIQTETSSTVIHYAGRKAILSIARDVTERKAAESAHAAAEEEIRQSRALLRTIIDGTPDSIYVKDPEGRYLLVNTATERFVGRPAAEILGKDDTALFPADEATRIMEADRRAMQDAAPRTWEETLTNSTGEVRTSSSTKGPIRREDGSLLGLFGVSRDVTEQSRIRAALELSEAKFATDFRTSPDSVNINRLSDGLFIEISDGFTEMTGFTRDDVEGRTSVEIAIWADPRTRERVVAALRADGVIRDMEMRFRRKNGDVGIGLMSGRLIEVNGEPCFLSITRDVTDRQLAH